MAQAHVAAQRIGEGEGEDAEGGGLDDGALPGVEVDIAPVDALEHDGQLAVEAGALALQLAGFGAEGFDGFDVGDDFRSAAVGVLHVGI